MADFFKTYVLEHIPDADIAAEMEDYPTPTNLKEPVPILDDYMKKVLVDQKPNLVKDQDADLAIIQQRILDAKGPLGAAWASLQFHQNGETPMVLEDLDNLFNLFNRHLKWKMLKLNPSQISCLNNL